MAAIVENRNGMKVMAKLVALRVNGNNSATKRKVNNHCHRFVHACLSIAYPRFGPFQPSRSELDRIPLKMIDFI